MQHEIVRYAFKAGIHIARIVAKVDQLMALCDGLVDQIREKSGTANRYAEAIVQQITAV